MNDIPRRKHCGIVRDDCLRMHTRVIGVSDLLFTSDSDPEKQLISGLDGLFVNFERTGRPAWRGGGFMELFFPNGHTAKQRQHMLAIWEDYFVLFQDKMTHYVKNHGKRAHKILDGTFPGHFREVLSTIPEDLWYDGRLYGYIGEVRPGEPTHYAISAGGKWSYGKSEPSTISAYFSSNWIVENRDILIGTMLKWCDRIKPLHGLCGLSMVRNFSSPPYSMRDNRAYPFLKRFPGLDYMDTAQFNLIARGKRGIRGVNWLTILDHTYVDKVGGRGVLGDMLSSDEAIIIHDYEGGVMIQAGALPALGDVTMGRFPEHYRSVSKVLKSVRFEDYAKRGYFRVPESLDEVEETLKWIRRFD